MRWLGLLVLVACGDTELLAPSVLAMVDGSPGQGAAVLPGEVPLLLAFSEPIDPATLSEAFLLEEITAEGAPVRRLPLAARLEPSTVVRFLTDPLLPDRYFALVVYAERLRAVSGARLPTDQLRRFRTLPDP